MTNIDELQLDVNYKSCQIASSPSCADIFGKVKQMKRKIQPVPAIAIVQTLWQLFKRNPLFERSRILLQLTSLMKLERDIYRSYKCTEC